MIFISSSLVNVDSKKLVYHLVNGQSLRIWLVQTLGGVLAPVSFPATLVYESMR